MSKEITQEIELGMTKKDFTNKERRAVLVLDTSKGDRGTLASDATVFWVGDHSRQHCFSMGGPGGDYSKRVSRSDPKVRATQGNLDKQHAAVFTAEVIADLVTAAKAHYEAQSHEAVR